MLIGINGEIGCGKSTATEYLTAKYKMTEYMLAKPLKDIAIILGFEHHQVYGTQEQKLEINKFWGISGRHFLQVFGSEVCRDFMPTVLAQMFRPNRGLWIRLFEKYLGENIEKNIIVSDVRFGDESKIVKEHGGYVIRITRGNREGSREGNRVNSAANSLVHTHQSETQADTIEPYIVIENNGTLEEFYQKLDEVVETIYSQNV
jgi:hypothetical protein